MLWEYTMKHNPMKWYFIPIFTYAKKLRNLLCLESQAGRRAKVAELEFFPEIVSLFPDLLSLCC